MRRHTSCIRGSATRCDEWTATWVTGVRTRWRSGRTVRHRRLTPSRVIVVQVSTLGRVSPTVQQGHGATLPATTSGAPLERCCCSGLVQVRGAGPPGPPSVGLQHGLQCPAEAGEVAVVDAAVVQLAGELTEQLRPVSAGWLEGDTDFDPPLDHLHRGPLGGRSAGLFPGSVAAGGGTPFGDRSPALRGDRPAAPPTGPCRGPPLATGHIRIRGPQPGHAGRGWLRPQTPSGLMLSPLLLTFTLSGSIPGAPASSHAIDAADEPSELVTTSFGTAGARRVTVHDLDTQRFGRLSVIRLAPGASGQAARWPRGPLDRSGRSPSPASSTAWRLFDDGGAEWPTWSSRPATGLGAWQAPLNGGAGLRLA